MSNSSFQPNRNSNVELLRFILMNMILIWHIFVHGFGFEGGNIAPDALQYLLMVITASSVNCFMLISGYYSIHFSFDKLINIVLQALGISILWQVLLICFGKNYEPNLNDFWLYFFPVSSYLWWFLSCYVLIMVLSPIINQGVSTISRPAFSIILLILIIYHSVTRFISVHSFTVGMDVLWMLTVYLIGRYIGVYKIKLARMQSLGLWCLSVAVVYAIGLFEIHSGQCWVSWFILGYNNIFILIAAIAILCFTLAFRTRVSPFINFIGRHCLAIYLLTEVSGWILYHRLVGLFSSSILLGFGVAITICFACILVDLPFSWINAKIRTYIKKRFNIILS